MIDLKINQEVKNFTSFNGIDEAFLPIFISKYLKFNKIVWMATAIISLTSNMNAFVYIIPCLIIEYLRYC